MMHYRESPLGQPTLPRKPPPAPSWKVALLWLADKVASRVGVSSRLQRVRARATRNRRHTIHVREEVAYQERRRLYELAVDDFNATPFHERGPRPLPPMCGGWHIPGWWGHG